MKLCWDNIENIKLTKKGNFRDIVRKITYKIGECKECDEEFLYQIGAKGHCCSKSCNMKNLRSDKNSTFNKNSYKKKCSESKKKLHKNIDSKYNSKEYIEKQRNITKNRWIKNPKSFNVEKNDNHYNWKGGYRSKGIPTYDTYAHQLEWCEEVRRNEDDPNVLEVKCFKCGEWFIPSRYNVNNKIQSINGNVNYKGNQHFYCSDQCRNACSIFGKTPETLMKEDAVRAGRLPWLELTREVQPELRSMVLKCDEHKCIKCDNTNDLQCHHIYPVNIEPLLSADIDNCITLCKECHIEVHQKDGCKYGQLQVEVCL